MKEFLNEVSEKWKQIICATELIEYVSNSKRNDKISKQYWNNDILKIRIPKSVVKKKRIDKISKIFLNNRVRIMFVIHDF